MTLINLVDLLVDMLVGISCCNMLVDIYDIYSNMLHGTIEHNMLWSKCLLPKMAESRVHMGARYIFFTFGTHSWLMKETWTDQTSIGAKL